MKLEEFKASIDQQTPPTTINDLLLALWYDAKKDWHAAHEIAQAREGIKDYDLLHAYLHRVEGDQWNADYWYRRAGSKMPKVSLDEEWAMLVSKWL
jgi:hypothetical protein